MAEIAERLPEGADEVVLGRRVSAGGRTSAFVAGRAASASDLKLLGGRLLAFYGQHEHRKLTISSAQMDVLDGFAGPTHLALRESYRAAHRECLRLAAELAELRERDGSRERDLDLFRYELSEIEEVAPDPVEGADLASERERLRPRRGAARGGCRRPGGGDRRRGGRRRRRRRSGPGRSAAAGRGRGRRRSRCARGADRRPRDRARRRRRRAARLPRRSRGGSGPARRDRRAARGARPAAAQARRQRRVGPCPRGALPGRDLPPGERRAALGRGRGGAGRRPRRAGPSSAASSARAGQKPPRRCSARWPPSWSGWRCRGRGSRSCWSRTPRGSA